MNEDNYNPIIIKISESITKAVNKAIDNAKYTWEFRTKIVEDLGSGYYRIKYCGREYKVRSSYSLNVGTMVRVVVPNNRFNDMYIIPFYSISSGLDLELDGYLDDDD